jgi:putative membrane protein
MDMNIGAMKTWIALSGMAVTAPGWAMSMVSATAAQPAPQDRRSVAAPLAIESWSAGSASLVPLMAADMPADRAPTVDVPADRSGGAVGKPLDDISFVRQATESGRKEVDAARDALPQLKTPELKRIAEMLVTDHGNANEKLSRLAAAKGWPVPGPQASAAPPSGTASSDFDAKWTADMIAGHEKALALYRAQAQGGEDKDLRKFARDTLPSMEHHLAELRSVQK